MTYGYDVYRRMQVETASPQQLVLLLYDGAIKAMRKAIKALDEGNRAEVNANLIKAQDIIRELMLSLDMEKGGDIAKNLWALYDFFIYKLIEANVNKDRKAVEEILGLVTDLRDAWAEAIKRVKKTAGG